jgi:hypothetical protein
MKKAGWFTLVLLGACNGNTDTDSDTDTDVPWGQESLDYLSERLGTYEGAWQLFGLDGADEVQESWAWTDVITASNLRIEEDRALMDIHDVMDMGGGSTYEMDFYEGTYIQEDGSMGDYFIEIDGEVTIMTEVSPDHWEYDVPLTDQDYQGLANISSANMVSGWKRNTKRVSWVEGWERHDVSILTHVEYQNEIDEVVIVEFTSLEGFHQKTAHGSE